MNHLFTKIAEQELKKDLYLKTLVYINKPYTTMSDFSLNFISIVFLPVFNICLTLLILIETTTLVCFSFYYYLTNDEIKYDQYINTCNKSAKIDIKILLATIFVSLFMLIIFLFRLIVTIISSLYMLINLEEMQLSQISLIKREKEALEKYNQLGSEIHEDLQLIKKYLKDLNLELNSHIGDKKNLDQEYKKLKNQLIMYSTFQQPEEYLTLQRESIRTDELSSMLQELIGNYPNATFNESSTIEEINAAYKELEEHHQKVVNIAVILFPDLNSFLTLVKQTKNLDLTSNCRCNNV